MTVDALIYSFPAGLAQAYHDLERGTVKSGHALALKPVTTRPGMTRDEKAVLLLRVRQPAILGLTQPASDTSGTRLPVLVETRNSMRWALVAIASGAPVPPEPEPAAASRGDVVFGGPAPTRTAAGFKTARTTASGEPIVYGCA